MDNKIAGGIIGILAILAGFGGYTYLSADDISNAYYLCVRANLKNYGEEIRKFLDWITPYLEKYEGEFLGFYRYEESEQPTLIYHKATKRQ